MSSAHRQNDFENTPIIVGVGQSVSHWRAQHGQGTMPSPIIMAKNASQKAIEDTCATGIFAKEIDTLALVRTMADSLPSTAHPFSSPVNMPGALAHDLGIAPKRLIYSDVGGQSPQSLVNEMAECIYRCETKTALIAGGEATGAMKTALRAKMKIDWSAPKAAALENVNFEDRGFGPALLSGYEMRHGMGYPVHVYPLFEEAWRRKNNLSTAQYRALIAKLLAPFSNIAADNPYAQFQDIRSEAFLKTRCRENYDISSPYLKWHVAQDAVNQGAAIIMTSVGEAVRLGIPKKKWVYLHGHAEVQDRFVTERADLSKSLAVEIVLGRALSLSGKAIADIKHIDIYSCFPSVVLFAAQAMGIDWRERPLTVTGGLPFFGGAGNNYSAHAIASLVMRLRHDKGQYGLILANGGYMSKEAAGVYSAAEKVDWAPTSNKPLEKMIDNAPTMAVNTSPRQGEVIAHTIIYHKDKPVGGYALCATKEGRCLAKFSPNNHEELEQIAAIENLKSVLISTKNGVNYLTLPV